MYAKTDVDNVDTPLHQTSILTVCVSSKWNFNFGYMCAKMDFNFNYMCVKTNVDIVDKSCTKISQNGEPLEINVDIVDSTISPKSKVNQASATSISTICVRKRT